MNVRSIHAILGLFVGAAFDIVINLLAAALQQRTFGSEISNQSLWLLIGLACLGLLIGFWLGKPLHLPAPAPSQTTVSDKADIVTVTRLHAILSYGKLKGKGIHLSDLLMIGSRLDIET